MSDRVGSGAWLCPGFVSARSGDVIEITLLEERCASCSRGCGARRLQRRLDANLPEPRVGDAVELSVPQDAVRRSAIGLFGMPLAGLLLGACVIAPRVADTPVSDALAAGLGGLGTALGVLAGLWSSRRARRSSVSLVTATPDSRPR